jgi:threonine aldolase
VALGVPASELARHADTVMFCFSKGLSAPVGSVLCGPRALIERARRYRRAVGGGMRQAGVLAAACQVALERQVARLAEDHAMARRLAEGLALLPGLGCNPETVETNIVMCWPHGGAPRCARLLTALRAQGVLLTQLTPNSLRAVTHRHIGPAQVDAALAAFRAVLTAEPA